MATHFGNLSTTERGTSALVGLALSVLALSRGRPLLRVAFGALAGGLLARAAAGHCGVKSALTGETSLGEGIKDQWHGMSNNARASAHGLPGSPLRSEKSQAVDQSVSDSFPASDPPASRLPDEPPVNAQAKWDAARAAGKLPE